MSAAWLSIACRDSASGATVLPLIEQRSKIIWRNCSGRSRIGSIFIQPLTINRIASSKIVTSSRFGYTKCPAVEIHPHEGRGRLKAFLPYDMDDCRNVCLVLPGVWSAEAAQSSADFLSEPKGTSDCEIAFTPVSCRTWASRSYLKNVAASQKLRIQIVLFLPAWRNRQTGIHLLKPSARAAY